MKKYKINNMDVIKWAEKYKGEKFHAMFCDAPYHLTTITKRFGKEGSAPAKFGKDGAFQRVGKGFMGQEWDGNMVSFDPETWEALGEHLYPGAFGMTFGGSRTAHRIAVAIEDAGFIIHPMISWVYGSGFPKATRVKGHKKFDGHRYGMQALKPAAEPVIVFQKPYEGKPVENITSSGAGALNIDAGRITSSVPYTINTWNDNAHPFGNGAGNEFTGRQEAARWPANFIIDDVVALVLDAQSGHLKSGKDAVRRKEGYFGAGGHRHMKLGSAGDVQTTYGDEGGASRFFFNVDTQLDSADPFIYCKKAGGQERDAGLEEFDSLSFGMSGGAQSKLKQGDEEYLQDSIDTNRISQRKNDHPTVKALSLTKYLAGLLLPPIEYAPRRVLVPFSGVSSEMIGAIMAGWDYVEGIELGKHYCELGEARIKHWMKQENI